MAYRPAQVYTGSGWDDVGDKRLTTHDHSGTTNGVNIAQSSVTNLTSDLAAKSDYAPAQNTQTGTGASAYTFVLADATRTTVANAASAATYTIPPTSSVAWVTGSVLTVTNIAAGVITFAGGAGVTVSNTATTLAQYQTAQLIRTGLNTWTVQGVSSTAGMSLVSYQTFTAEGSVILNNVFSASAANYRVLLYSNNSGSLLMRLRASGTSNSSANYDHGRYKISSGSAGNGVVGGLTEWPLQGEYNDALNSVTMDILRPFDTQPTIAHAQIWAGNNAGAQLFYAAQGMNHRLSTSYDGLEIYLAGAGAFTGSVAVLAYKN